MSRWDANWLEANTENKIRMTLAKNLAAAAGRTPITSATNLGEERIAQESAQQRRTETLNVLASPTSAAS